MAHILAFAGSNSLTSINYKLLKFTTTLLQPHQVKRKDMAQFSVPMYSADVEKNEGFPEVIVALKEDITAASALVLSVNEHNGNPSAYFKNVVDWLSRLDKNFLEGKPIFLMATSPGKQGGSNALEVAKKMLTHFGARIVTTFSLPSFNTNFDPDKGIIDRTLAHEHKRGVALFLTNIT
ncbi:NAD(P)H-dependent oxidoreductase [Arenibacter sp. GZD96]|nr:NAD(P)H-dependent oxidoreductase [Arenibacter sp. GZD-96]